MRIKKFFKFIISAVRDPERDFTDRVFVIFSIISEIAVIIALIADILMGESPGEIATLIGVIITVPVVTFSALYRNRISIAIKFLIISLVLIILPSLFFFGGGLNGGGFIWMIFGFMYVGLVTAGKWRRVFFVLMFLETTAMYLAAYFFPELIYEHSREMTFVDTYVSLVLVGIVCFAMTWFQNRLFTEENERARKETERAEELTRSQNRFFSSMSHEIRTPINSILGLNELILRDQTASDEIIRDASGIQGAGRMLLSLINDILDFSKMEAGSMEIVPVDYKIGDMLSEIVNMIWLRAHEKDLEFKVSIDPDVPAILYGDEVRIKQVIINLLNNAVKYTKEGSISLHMESEETGEDKVALSISVSDTGMGIKKESLPYLFDAFKRVDEEKNRHIEGTGLGLSIVKQIVELMGGTVSVNSVYGEGSTFTVVVEQGVSDHTAIGELNIHDKQAVRKNAYESGFKAPEASVLIVDDNEMNLEVECKLLAGTEIDIDKAISGKEALEKTLSKRYDTILMDHLMPEMDGIDCLNRIRNQSGGMNRGTPVVVLTANAGSDNRELYNRAGFDGYLVKPVSGEALENTLVKHISSKKVVLGTRMYSMRDDIKTADGYTGKIPVIISSSSMCDLPERVIKRLNLPIIPFIIKTEEGMFKDGVQINADELVRYLGSGKDAVSSPPDVNAYTEFFSRGLKHAHHMIHIALTTSMSTEYNVASEAAETFDNVTVINSENLSSSTGLLVLIAHRLTKQNKPVDEIVRELEDVKKRLRCSFIINTTEYMAKRGLISHRIDALARSFYIHPSLKLTDDKSGIGGFWIGSTKSAYKSYIKKAFPVDIIPDQDVVFITYVDVPLETLFWIREEISKYAYFENVIFKQASAAISSNCGPGTFGILYFVKSNRSYNLGPYVAHEESNNDVDEDEEFENLIEYADEKEAVEDAEEEESKAEWYEQIEGIDGRAAINNSGSEDAFKTVLKIFYDSIRAKSSEIEGYYADEDWSNYTIKVHALKSSAKLIGAIELSDRAQLLENAGKEADIDYIRSHHDSFMEDYKAYAGILGPVFGEGEGDDESSGKSVADEAYMKDVYDKMLAAARDMDCDVIEEVLEDLNGYILSDTDREKCDAIRERSDSFDYDGIVELLENG